MLRGSAVDLANLSTDQPVRPEPLPYHRGVGSKNSCGVMLVVFQKPTEPFTTLNGTCTRCVFADRRKEEYVALALMIPLVMKMLHVLRQRMAERRFPKEDEPRETLLLDRAHPTFRVGVQ